MGTVLKAYPSRSKPGKEYRIIRGNDGVTYCECWQWKLNRTCKHLEDYLQNQTQFKATYKKVDNKPTLFLELSQAIENAVKELS